MALLQDDAGAMQHDVHLLTIFIGIIAAAVVILFVILLIGGVMALGFVKKAHAIAERVEGKASPLIDKTNALVEELSPKIRTITTNVEQISYTVRGKVDEFSATASEINRTVKDVNARTQQKVSRVDTMVTDALNSIHHVSHTIQEGVRKPVQQVAGIISGLKRGLETLAERSPLIHKMRTHQARPTADATTNAYESTSAGRESTSGFKRTPYDL
jgi:methyl-accepting chemotaxis protein